MLQGSVHYGHVRAIAAGNEQIPRVLARGRCEQYHPGLVRQTPEQVQTLPGVSSGAVQQEQQRRRTLRPVRRRHVQVALPRGAKHKRLQADRRHPAHLCRSRPQASFSLFVVARHVRFYRSPPTPEVTH